MAGGKAARRQAKAAAAQADFARAEAERQRQLLKERTEKERRRAQRILLRGLRAGAGGVFETDTANGTLGGGGEVLG